MAVPNTMKFLTAETNNTPSRPRQQSVSSRGSYLTGMHSDGKMSRYTAGSATIRDRLMQRDLDKKAQRKQMFGETQKKFGRFQPQRKISHGNVKVGFRRQMALKETEIEEVRGIYAHKKDLHKYLKKNSYPDQDLL